MNVGEKIKDIRKQKGLTMRELASIAGTSQQQIDRLEKGQRRMTIEWLEKISNALGHNPHNLLAEEIENDLDRNISTTAKAKIIGSIEKDGMIRWFGKNEIYPIIFGRPAEQGQKLFGLANRNWNIPDYPPGSELIFNEISQEDDDYDFSSNIALIEYNNKYGGHFAVELPFDFTDVKLQAVMVKSIRNE